MQCTFVLGCYFHVFNSCNTQTPAPVFSLDPSSALSPSVVVSEDITRQPAWAGDFTQRTLTTTKQKGYVNHLMCSQPGPYIYLGYQTLNYDFISLLFTSPMFYFLKKIILFHNDINNEKYEGRSLVLDLVSVGKKSIIDTGWRSLDKSILWLINGSSFWCLELTKNINNIANHTHYSYRRWHKIN